MFITITISTTVLAIIFGTLLGLSLVWFYFKNLANNKKRKVKTSFSTNSTVELATIRVDAGKDYHTQRNNKIRPFGTCASTSMAMALRYSGYDLSFIPQNVQDEDYITNFIHTDPTVIKFWQNNPSKWIRDSYVGYLKYKNGQQSEKNTMFGNEIADVLTFGINTMMKSKVDAYVFECSIQKIFLNLIQGGAVVVSGVWPYKSGSPINHVVCLVGFKTQQTDISNAKKVDQVDLSKIDSLIIDDPYGDYHTLYNSVQGNDVSLPYNDFINIVKDPGNKLVKRAHLIVPKIA